MTLTTKLDSHRLCGAADRLLEAIRSREGMDSLVSVHITDSISDPPTHPSHYTLPEMIEAMGLLMRLGLVPAWPDAADTNHHAHPSNQTREERQTEANGESRRLGVRAKSPSVRAHEPRTRPRGTDSHPRRNH
jgi:hypothetical protein